MFPWMESELQALMIKYYRGISVVSGVTGTVYLQTVTNI